MNSGRGVVHFYQFVFLSFVVVMLIGCLHNNQAPIADAGHSQSVMAGNYVQLSGLGSYDPDGEIVEYKWQFEQKPENSHAYLEDAFSSEPSFVADVPGVYLVRLIVFDGELYSGRDIVAITADDGLVGQFPEPPIMPPIHPPRPPVIPPHPNHPPIMPFSDHVALIDTLFLVPVNLHLSHLSSTTDSLNKPMPPQMTPAHDLSSWHVIKQPEGAMSELELVDINGSLQLGFTGDTAGDYILELMHNDPFPSPITRVIHVQESEVYAGEDRSLPVNESIPLQLSIIDELNSRGTHAVWEIISMPDGSEAVIIPLGNVGIFDPDLIGEYEISVSVDMPSGVYTDTIVLEVTEVVEPPPPPTIPEGLALTIESDKASYAFGETITVTAILTNDSDKPIDVFHHSSVAHGIDVVVLSPEGPIQLMHPDDDAFGLPVTSIEPLQPGDSIVRTVQWDQRSFSGRLMNAKEFPIIASAVIVFEDGVTRVQMHADLLVQIEDWVAEVDAIVLGLSEPVVKAWYEDIRKSILCQTETLGLVQVNNYVATPINTLVPSLTFAPVPDSEINCHATLHLTDRQWEVSYKGTTPNDMFEHSVFLDAITGEIITPNSSVIESNVQNTGAGNAEENNNAAM